MPTAPVIHLFRQDLRLTDNRALAAAAASGRGIVPLYILDEAQPWPPGGASRWWLHESLASLSLSLGRAGSGLVLRRGSTIQTVLRVAEECGARAIHLTRAYEPAAIRTELDLKAACEARGIAVHRYSGNVLHEPETIANKSGDPFRVFTPFWRTIQAQATNLSPTVAPTRLRPPKAWPAGERLADWKLQPTNPDWAGGLRATWTPGEAGASTRLARLIDGALRNYADGRDRPDRPNTSMLSPHLHFGEISPGQCWSAVTLAAERDPTLVHGATAFLRELGWREFSYHLLFHWPDLPERPFRPEFADFPWEFDSARARRNLTLWSRGHTGYPIVDAGMRQLWQTGWMHNRVRMIVASFLTKHLLVPWQEGERWFWDTLVDADLASNAASWQWVAGSGADAAPYFRIFNPMLQGQKFDPEGHYVRRYVPELAGLPDSYINAPWTAPAAILAKAGITLGSTYPLPIVDHAEARARALDAYAKMKPGHGEFRAPDKASGSAPLIRKGFTNT